MSSTETPPKDKSRTDAVTAKVGIGLVVLLGLVALVVAGTSGKSSSTSDVLQLASSTPTNVTVPSISASSSLISLGKKPDGELEVPPLVNPKQASWYDGSPSPGTLGPAVILGHINGDGKPGIFYKLKDVKGATR